MPNGECDSNELTFSDEFDGNALKAQKRHPNDPWGRERNQELQAYVPGAPDEKTKLPAACEVDYVRVFQRAQ